jgi:hypothetical protein
VRKFFPLKLFLAYLIFPATGKEVLGGSHDDGRTLRCNDRTLHFVHARGALAKRQRWGPDMRSIPLAPLSDISDPELRSLLHPASAFDRPEDVVRDPDLTTEEKRAILSSWASDACSVESHPTMRLPPGTKHPVSFDEVVDALRSLDSGPLPKWKRVLRRQRSGSNENTDGGLPLT